MKITEKMVEVLKEMGANEWHKGSYNRLYLNEAVDELIGLKTECYKSGSISAAWLKGERISNAEAGRIVFRTCKAYVNLDTMELVTTSELLMTAVEEKEAEIAEEEAVVEETAEEATDDDNTECTDDNAECTFERVQGEDGCKSDFLCSNGKYIKKLGAAHKERYVVDGKSFKYLRFAMNYCEGKPLDRGMKKLIIPTPPSEG